MTGARSSTTQPGLEPRFFRIMRAVTSWIFILLYLPVVAIISILTLGALSRRYGYRVARTFGGTILWILGIEVVMEGGERMATRAGRVVTFNHTSSLDVSLMASVTPPGGTSAVKKEMIWIPIIGVTAWLLKFVMLDRGNRERARRSLSAAADRVRTEELTLQIAPEGTRSPGGPLGPFKLGAFHLARNAGVPILPAVVHGASWVWPRSTLFPRKGKVYFRLLAPFDVSEESGDIRERADALREIYIAELARLEAEFPLPLGQTDWPP